VRTTGPRATARTRFQSPGLNARRADGLAYSGFAPGKKAGDETDFRDGSGNDVAFDDDDLPPF
jgi:hypothetical protein